MKKYIFILMMIPAFLSCSSFLDVNPKGEVFDKDMFESAEGYEDALYGVYAFMGTNDYLYPGYMHWFAETCAQNISADNYTFESLRMADWEHVGATIVRNNMWASAYSGINYLNNIIEHAQEDGTERFQYSELYLGEALALRAMIHFDLVRTFAVSHKSTNQTAKDKAIPYVTNYSYDITEFSSLDEVYEKIIAELKQAEELLGDDETLVTANRNNTANGFTSCRTTHINLYAVQALLARVYWTMDDMDNAAIYAKKVIDSGKFSFRPSSAFVQPDNGTLDMNETIFGIYSTKAQENNNGGSAYAPNDGSGQFVLASDYQTLYEDDNSSSTDYRVGAWYNTDLNTLKKLVNPSYYTSDNSYTGNSILGINIIRLPEMYYILAESLLESNPAEATKYYDAVIQTRGLTTLTSLELTVTEENLYNERRKEFYGEGQQWFNMKRLQKDIPVNAILTLDGKSDATYTMPIPSSEDLRDEVEK